MALQSYRLAAAEALLAAAILAIGVPSIASAWRELSLDARLAGGTAGTTKAVDWQAAIAAIGSRPESSPSEREKLAFALLDQADKSPVSDDRRMALINQAADEFRNYLADVPGDGRAWAGLADARLQSGDRNGAVQALKMSILTAPWLGTLLAWRCGLGLDLFGALDLETRELLSGQFRVAIRRSAPALVRTVVSRKAALAARILLASSPDELILFEQELAKLR
jgi:hypothetical protein